MAGATRRPAAGATLLTAAVLYFLSVFGAGFVLGAIRVLWVIPRVGVRTAELLEMPVMLIVIVLSARWLDRRFLRGCGPAQRVIVGTAALVLLLAAEVALAIALGAASVRQALFDRDPVSGTAYYLALVVFAILPWWLGRRARPETGGSD